MLYVFLQAEDGIRGQQRYRGVGDGNKRQRKNRKGKQTEQRKRHKRKQPNQE